MTVDKHEMIIDREDWENAQNTILLLVGALKDCTTDQNALGYAQPCKYARRRFMAINEIIVRVLAKTAGVV